VAGNRQNNNDWGGWLLTVSRIAIAGAAAAIVLTVFNSSSKDAETKSGCRREFDDATPTRGRGIISHVLHLYFYSGVG